MQISSTGSSGYISGLATGIDTSGMISQLAELRKVPITQLQTQKTQQQSVLAAYQSLSASLLALSTSALNLQTPSTWQGRSLTNTQPDLAAASVSSGAPTGTYSLTVNQLASAHKLSSGPFASAEEALGLSGTFLLNGEAISLSAEDSLAGLAATINDANAGVSATVLHVSGTAHRLVLTAGQTGAEHALDLREASATDLLEGLGLVSGTATTKHALTAGAASDYFTSASTAVGALLGLESAPSGTLTLTDNTGSYAVDLSLGGSSLTQLAEAINTAMAGSGMTAAVTSTTQDGVPSYRLEVTGSDGSPVLADDGNVLQALGVLTKAPAHQIQAARDAEFVLDGYTLTRAGNSVDDAISGLSLQLLDAAPGQSLTLEVSADHSDGVAQVRSFVSRYNAIMDTLNQGMDYNTETEASGIFFGDSSIMLLQMQLISQAIDPVSTLAGRGGATSLSALGLSVNADGTLTLDEGKLQDALAEDPLSVQRLMSNTGWTSADGVEYISAGQYAQDSGDAGYAVQITRFAARSTAQSAALAGGITQAETLNFDGAASVTLQAGWSLAQARDALNAAFGSSSLDLTAAVEDNRLVVRHDLYGAGYRFEVTSSLADGSGGTDLGGATAGVAETYANGQDVAGTLNGETATGRGQYLTGADGNDTTAGLMLRITAESGPADQGQVYVSKGLGSRMQDFLLNTTAEGSGSVALGMAALSARMEDLDTQATNLNAQVDAYIAELQLKFNAMEQTVARMQTLGSWLTQQLDALTQNTSQ